MQNDNICYTCGRNPCICERKSHNYWVILKEELPLVKNRKELINIVESHYSALTPWKDKNGERIKCDDEVEIEVEKDLFTTGTIYFNKMTGSFDIRHLSDEMLYSDSKIPLYAYIQLNKVSIVNKKDKE